MTKEQSPVARSYAAETQEEQEAAYNDWAQAYEADLCRMGYRLPAMIAAVFGRFVDPQTGPILDAGCGTGLQTEALHLAGYGPFTGIDLSEGMLAMARRKGIYASLHRMALGGPLDFADGAFAATLSSGTITPGHAPPSSFDELIRVTAPGGRIIFSLRDDPAQDPAYMKAVEGHVASGAWGFVYRTDGHQSMPLGEPEVVHRIHVYERRG